MPPPQRDRWAEWREIAVQRREAARQNLKEWWDAVRAEPELFWQTAAVRYSAYIIGGLLIIMIARGAIDLLKPAGKFKPVPRASTAHFDVMCSNEACGRHFVIEKRFSFDDFPVHCPYCAHETGQRAMRCSSPACQGALRRMIEVDGQWHCAQCGQRMGMP